MAGSLFYILDPKRLESASSASSWLGRIVRSYEAPDSIGFTPRDPTPFTEGSIKTSPTIDDVEQRIQSSSNSSLKALLTEIAEIGLEHGAKGDFSFKASSIVPMRLENYPKVYKKLSMNPEVKADLKEWLTPGGKPAYMIVGLLIWTDASFEDTISQESSLQGKAKLPAVEGFVKAHTGTSASAGDPAIEASKTDTKQVVSKGSVKGKNIFAFEYKAVRRRYYSLVGDPTPKSVENYGPRVSGDRLFAGLDQEGTVKPEAKSEDVGLEMDEDDSVWTDTLGEDAPSEEELGDIVFAFHPKHS